MRKFEKIVVGTEFDLQCKELTHGALLATDQALWLAERVGAHVTLVHSGARDEFWDNSRKAYVLKESLAPAESATALNRVASRFHEHGIPTELVASSEAAWIAITQAVLSENSDLVIVGKRTERGDKGRKIGAVTQKLLRKCPAVVWAVDPDTEPTPKTILAATDLTLVGERVIEIAATLAAEKGSQLHIVHAYEMPLEMQMEGGYAQAEFEKKARAEAEEEIHRQLEDCGMSDVAVLHLGLSSPARAIMECVDRLEPDLVAMGTIARGGIPGLLIGNTAERLLARLDCSLLTVKPADFVCPLEATSDTPPTNGTKKEITP